MKSDLFPWLNYVFSFKLAYLTNLGYAISCLCYIIIFLKIKHSPSVGRLRTYLLSYFGAAAITAFLMCFYHPIYNFWLTPVAHIVIFVALLAFTGHILNEFWKTKPQ